MPRVVPKPGEKWRAVQGRWEIVADNEDRRAQDCAAFYDDVRAGLSVAPAGTAGADEAKSPGGK
ncbi:conserved hypothetical protein [uncultured Pleomorphomonas sp.]|uniref:Uncharacterized protein n=1 Tax=uncultured Pleomorphomonas sp. TaxID=442121 RepID=A0A212LRG6_9HYPH|nr:hypothetical protein [uncultured Pleomorphomonas sp.]SCM80020.1 conserved hypothetical protein [uncultured Pleomorphomonas sp.]